MGFHDAAARAFTETQAYATVVEQFELEPLWVLPSLREAMLSAYRDWGGSGDPAIAIVDWSDVPLMPEFEIIRDDLHRRRDRSHDRRPAGAAFTGGRLRCGEDGRSTWSTAG